MSDTSHRRSRTLQTPFQKLLTVVGLSLPGINLYLHKSHYLSRPILTAVAACAITTVILFIAFDPPVPTYDAFPSFDAAWRSVLYTCLSYGFWTFIVGMFIRTMFSDLWAIGVVTAPITAGLVAVPTSAVCMVFRRRKRALPRDNYIHCRNCDYRVDNLPGPRCPECGTPIAGIIERDNG